MYYHAKDYEGHFRFTEQNNCSLPGNKNNCTGHLVDIPCKWYAYTDSQIFWNEIALDKTVPGKPNGYSSSDFYQILAASHATRSPAMFVWWYPTEIIAKYDLQPVALPKTTRECLQNRPITGDHDRCDAELSVLRGKQVGSCGYNAHELEKVLALTLKKNDISVTNEAERSPAYDMLRNIRISDFDMVEVLAEWDSRGIDRYGYDPREAVCSWVAANLFENQNLTEFIPPGFPRKIEDFSYNDNSGLLPGALVFAFLAVAVVLSTATITALYRKQKVLQYAQLHFLALFCVGYFLVAIGATILATAPATATCMAIQWLVVVGYTVGIVPLLVKIYAINHIMQQAKRMRRVQISQQRLLGQVTIAVFIIATFLSIWTALDPSKKTEEPILTSPEGTVEIQVSCSSDSPGWEAVAFAWEGIYMVCAAVLAFASRNIRQEFNESHKIGNMAYSHSLFLVLRLIVRYVLPYAGMHYRKVAATTSILLSADSITSLSLYFLPKFLAIRRKLKRGKAENSLQRSNLFQHRAYNGSSLTMTAIGASHATSGFSAGRGVDSLGDALGSARSSASRSQQEKGQVSFSLADLDVGSSKLDLVCNDKSENV
mmetsp:Transcript_6441/g.18928  ORF Transcript_6441/g.18928 Transcript_6441/m.18928 type:complete len:600 (-) Transcript_6441:129-1928(-)